MAPLCTTPLPIPRITDILLRFMHSPYLQINQQHLDSITPYTRRHDTTSKKVASYGASGGSNSTQAPALSPSAIVGISILGAMFFCVACAAMLRYFQRPDPTTEPNAASLYRPENDSQLEHMKQVREFNRSAAWERAEEARTEDELKEEQRIMGKMLSGEKTRLWGAGLSKGRRSRQDWQKRVGLSAMEAGGVVTMDEGDMWPLVGQRRGTLLGGPRDYSDGAYADTSSGSAGERGGDSRSGSSSGDHPVVGCKGKQPDRRGEPDGQPEEMKRFTCPPVISMAQGATSQHSQAQEQQMKVAKVPDYYD